MLRSPKLRYPKYHPGMMPTSRDLPADRLAIGQLLVRLLRAFRAELFEPAAGHGYPDLREPHLHIFGNLGVDGIRLTDLAARAQLSLAGVADGQREVLGFEVGDSEDGAFWTALACSSSRSRTGSSVATFGLKPFCGI
jgi:hypothetical protein